jgi:acyl carrier protein
MSNNEQLTVNHNQYKNEIATKLKHWISEKNPEINEIEWETDIIQQRILDSLQMVNFLLYIEELRGKEIDEEQIKPHNFKSIETIYDQFFITKNN